RDHQLREDDFELFLRNWMDSAQAGLNAKSKFTNYLQLTYESLLVDTVSQARQLLEFLAIPTTPEQLHACVTAASFKELSGGRHSGEEDSQSFFRKGTVGDWRNWFQ